MPTKIEWTDEPWNPITGCTRISPGCGGPANEGGCYAERLAATRLKHHHSREGLAEMTPKGPRWTGEVRFNELWLEQPLRWKNPRMIFVCPHGDLFHEKVLIEWIDRIWAIMTLASHHTYQVLTKRPARMREYLADPSQPKRVADILAHHAPSALWNGSVMQGRADLIAGPLKQIWTGTSVESQQYVEERIPDLLLTRTALRWVSAEPLLSHINMAKISTMRFVAAEILNAYTGELFDFLGEPTGQRLPTLNWVVVGGESGPRARDFDPEWGDDILEHCERSNTAFFYKQLGVKRHKDTYKDFDNWPAHRQVRQWPDVDALVAA